MLRGFKAKKIVECLPDFSHGTRFFLEIQVSVYLFSLFSRCFSLFFIDLSLF